VIELRVCKRLLASITERQCKVNREGYRYRGLNFPAIVSCQGCAGLGESAQISLPVQEEEKKMAKHRCGKKNCTRAVKEEGGMCWQHKGLEDQIGAGAVEGVAAAAQEGSSVGDELPVTLVDLEQTAGEFVETVIEREAFIPPARQTGLSALLRPLPPPIPEPDGLLIPFSREEVVALIESEVSAEHIREFVLMGLAGELVRADAA
jgi:hypothetical protein